MFEGVQNRENFRFGGGWLLFISFQEFGFKYTGVDELLELCDIFL
jgi:hypothetical protein